MDQSTQHRRLLINELVILDPLNKDRIEHLLLHDDGHVAMVAKRVGVESMTLRKMIKDGPRLQAAMDETFEIAVDEAVGVPEFWGEVQPPASLKRLDIPSRRTVFVPRKLSRRPAFGMGNPTFR